MNSDMNYSKEARGAAETVRKGFFVLEYTNPYCMKRVQTEEYPNEKYRTWSAVESNCENCGKTVNVLMD
ncbi:MAG: hypothetical protein IJ642_12865 [Oscillospiraceae bacterium]|nr:hypothetical protein [Oscillospiraceae bacterium]